MQYQSVNAVKGLPQRHSHHVSRDSSTNCHTLRGDGTTVLQLYPTQMARVHPCVFNIACNTADYLRVSSSKNYKLMLLLPSPFCEPPAMQQHGTAQAPPLTAQKMSTCLQGLRRLA